MTKFDINGHTWTVEDFQNNKDFDKENNFGQCCEKTQIIYIDFEIPLQQIRSTIMHELIHCWLWEYGHVNHKHTDEDLANICVAFMDWGVITTNKILKANSVKTQT